MKAVRILLCLALGSGAPAVAQGTPQQANTAPITPNGYFRAEHGEFSLERDILCSYSSNTKDATHAEQECYRLVSGAWQPTLLQDNEPAVPSQRLDFSPCDPLNQLDITMQHSEIAATLPHSAAIKQVIVSEQSAVVVYSDTPAQRVRYSLRIASLVAHNGKWGRVGDWPIGTDNFFCGIRLIPQHSGAVALVYLDEPAASSNYLAVRSFLLNWSR